MKRIAIALAASLACTSFAAHAAPYEQVQLAHSRITFTYQQMGVKMDGSFARFSGELRFDPEAPAAAKASIEVDLASVSTGSDDGDEEIATRSWFNTSAFPSARFESTGVTGLGDNRYEVAGTLTIKGTTREVVVPARFSAQGGQGAFDGSLVIRRGDFSIGEGAWKAFDVVANDVVIQFHIAVAQ